MFDNPLGKKTIYVLNYDKSLLYPIPRKINREQNGINPSIFSGYDAWNCYEFTFLDNSGKPLAYILKIAYDCDSENMVESKSLKLYLGSFSMTKFKNIEDAIEIIKSDLKTLIKADNIVVGYFESSQITGYSKIENEFLLDNIETDIGEYDYNPDLLRKIEKNKKETVVRYSNLLKTNCPITGQPDYATVFIKYESNFIIDDESLLKYIVSFRGRGDYHENCCESIFNDIYNLINPDILVIKCFFTRRGGIDINPCRFFGVIEEPDFNFHFWRQ